MVKVIKSSQCKPDLYLLHHRKYANKQDASEGFKKCFVICGFSVSVNGSLQISTDSTRFSLVYSGLGSCVWQMYSF